MTKRQIVYYILDSIKSVNGDSFITEDHVLFLMNSYRSFLIEMKKQKDKLSQLSQEFYQEICLDLEVVDTIPGVPCTGQYLRSVDKIPSMIDSSLSKIYPQDQFNDNITYVSKERFKNVGYNKYMGNLIYATKGIDDYLYLKSNNPQHQYLQSVRLSGVFEDTDKADELSCDKQGTSADCIDPLDKDFPIASDLLPQMMEFIVKELKQAMYTQADQINDSADTIADLVGYIRRNMKSDLAKQLTT